MDCVPNFSSPKAPIFVTGTKLSIAIQSLEACIGIAIAKAIFQLFELVKGGRSISASFPQGVASSYRLM